MGVKTTQPEVMQKPKQIKKKSEDNHDEEAFEEEINEDIM